MADERAHPGAQRPRPRLAATPDGAGTDFAACWARLTAAWQLPAAPLATLQLSVADLRAVALECFAAGGVHHVEITRQFIERLGEAPDRAWLQAAAIRARYTDQGRRTTAFRGDEASREK